MQRASVLIVVSTAALLVSGLTGPHVCHRVVNYTVTSREQYVEPVEILTLAWCLQIPPRCPQTRTELRERWRMKTEVKYKTVPVCCEGYVMQDLVGNGSADAKCVPFCKKCRSGTCTAPNECTCDPGYQGKDCTFDCPQGTWGRNCENECSCLQREPACNPVSGKCDCPPGWTGPRCESECPEGQWGAGCSSICLCADNPQAACHHETGECPEPGLLANSVPQLVLDPFEASGNLLVPAKTVDYVDVIDFDREPLLTRVTDRGYESVTGPVPSLPDEMIPVVQQQQQQQQRPLATEVSASSPRTTEEKPTGPPPTPAGFSTTTSTTEGNQLSQPDVDENKTSFEFDERDTNFRVIVSPKTDYVKTTRKGGSDPSMAGIPFDVAAMIVIGALVSIGLTSVAAVMIFHVRSRLLKAALSIYNQEKLERQYAEKNEAVAVAKGLDLTIGTLPRGTMTRVNPLYSTNSDAGSAVLTLDERPVEYANGTVTIGIRLSSNLRDLLESHYDRPASQQQQRRNPSASPLAPGEPGEVEHVYDEIPLSAPFYFDKYT